MLIYINIAFSFSDFVYENLGKTFVVSPSIDLNILFKDTSSTTPLVINFLCLVKERWIHTISLGQGL